MYRKTTPTIGFTFPDNILASSILSVILTVKQQSQLNPTNYTYVKDGQGNTLDKDSENERRFYHKFTQAETGAFSADEDLQVQVKAKIGSANDWTVIASKVRWVKVDEILNTTEFT